MAVSAYWSLSSVYFFYFAVLGATNPYWGLYLQSLGFAAEQIGTLMAVFIATKLVAPNIWSYWADRKQAHIQVMRLGAVLTPCCFLLVYLQQGFWTMLLAMLAYSFFWNAILPQYEVITLKAIKGQEERYSQIRLWGSVGFIAAVAGLGWLLDYIAVAWLPIAIFLIMGLMALASWGIRLPVQAAAEPGRSETVPLRHLLRRREIQAFLLAVLLMQASHGPYYTFFSIFMEQTGYSRSVIGLLWSLGVLAEVALFAIMHRVLQRFSARQVLQVSLVLAAVRWALTGYYPDILPVLLLLQLLHAATFGCFHAASIALVQSYFPGRHAAQGQALYSSLGFGVGGALGAWGSGMLWQYYDAQVSYLVAAGFAATGAVVMLYRQHKPDDT